MKEEELSETMKREEQAASDPRVQDGMTAFMARMGKDDPEVEGFMSSLSKSLPSICCDLSDQMLVKGDAYGDAPEGTLLRKFQDWTERLCGHRANELLSVLIRDHSIVFIATMHRQASKLFDALSVRAKEKQQEM